MKTRELLIGLVGLLIGIVIGYSIYKKRKELMYRLDNIYRAILESDMYDRVKNQLTYIKESLTTLIEGAKDLPSEKEDEILNIVEEKIKRLEDIIKP